MRSIERTLLAWILGALSLGAMVIVLVTYLVALEEMHDVLDANLKNVAEAVANYHHAGQSLGGKDLIVSPQRNDTPKDDEIVTLTWSPRGATSPSTPWRVTSTARSSTLLGAR